jgi:hypothetical protein
MDSTIVAAIVVTIALIIATVIGSSKSRSKSEEWKSSDGNQFSFIDSKPIKNEKLDNNQDIPVFSRLQEIIDLNWIQKFEANQLAYPQYVQVAVTDELHAYWDESQKPENAFLNSNLAEAHFVFIKAIKAFQRTVIQNTTFVRPESNTSVVNSKADGHRKSSLDYDERYDREVKNITNRARGIIISYKRYVQVARNERVYR